MEFLLILNLLFVVVDNVCWWLHRFIVLRFHTIGVVLVSVPILCDVYVEQHFFIKVNNMRQKVNELYFTSHKTWLYWIIIGHRKRGTESYRWFFTISSSYSAGILLFSLFNKQRNTFRTDQSLLSTRTTGTGHVISLMLDYRGPFLNDVLY